METEDHTHNEDGTHPEGYFPPVEAQLQMMFQENQALTEANLKLRMQTSFQVQIIDSLKAHIESLGGEAPADGSVSEEPDESGE